MPCRLTALLEPSQALEYLAYLGFTYQTGFCYLAGDNPTVDGFGLPSASQTPPPPVSLGGCLVNEANSLLRGLNVTSERRMDYIRRQTNRTVFYCRVYGARKVGKVSGIEISRAAFFPSMRSLVGRWVFVAI